MARLDQAGSNCRGRNREMRAEGWVIDIPRRLSLTHTQYYTNYHCRRRMIGSRWSTVLTRLHSPHSSSARLGAGSRGKATDRWMTNNRVPLPCTRPPGPLRFPGVASRGQDPLNPVRMLPSASSLFLAMAATGSSIITLTCATHQS